MAHVENVSIARIKCLSICNKCDKVCDVVKDVHLDAVIITETRLTGNISDQKIIDDVTPDGY